jgi:plastocyanin
MRRFIAFIVVVAATVAIAAPSASGRANATVNVADDIFAPESKTIKEDKIVKFVWVGTNDHDVYKQIGPGPNWTSGVKSGEGATYSRKFKKPGKYVLACSLHPDMLMDLKVKKKRRRN